MGKKLFEPEDENKEEKIKDLKTKTIGKLEDLILPEKDIPECFKTVKNQGLDELDQDIFDSITQSVRIEPDKIEDFRIGIYFGEETELGCICYFKFKKEEYLENYLEEFFEYSYHINRPGSKRAFSLVKGQYAVIFETSNEPLKEGIGELYRKTKNRFDMKEIKRKVKYSID